MLIATSETLAYVIDSDVSRCAYAEQTGYCRGWQLRFSGLSHSFGNYATLGLCVNAIGEFFNNSTLTKVGNLLDKPVK